MNKMKKNYQARQDANLVDHIGKIEKLMRGLVNFLQRLFQYFDTQTQDLWDNLSAERFEKAKKLIPDYHTTIWCRTLRTYCEDECMDRSLPKSQVSQPHQKRRVSDDGHPARCGQYQGHRNRTELARGNVSPYSAGVATGSTRVAATLSSLVIVRRIQT